LTEQEQLLQFHDASLRSGLVNKIQWADAIATVGEDPAKLAAHFVAMGTLTSYQSQQLRAGRGKLTLGPYLITGWIGQGGMGQVFKAVHTVMGRESAVKVLPLEKSTAESRESFQREIRLQAGLDCPYLVRAYDAGHDGNVHYLVTEYVPGTDLRRLVRSRGPLPVEQAAMILRQAALGLQYAHDQGLVHRDVKPGNVLVTPDGHAKVSDVGLAAWSMGLADDPRAGKIVGTADYLSPEQIRSPMAVGPLSDIYSLGCTTYYAVTGKVPYPGGDARSKCRRHLEETPWHPRKFVPDLAEEFVDLIADMMEKDPAKRIGSADEVAERFLGWCEGGFQPVSSSLSRSPWTPAPPPAEAMSLSIEMPSIPSDDQRSELSHGSIINPPPMPYTGAEAAPVKRSSSVMSIAITLAIVAPVCLLIGAIIGFIVRGKM
jgi:eukaryotic-like serine/threonine-protein kinase